MLSLCLSARSVGSADVWGVTAKILQELIDKFSVGRDNL